VPAPSRDYYTAFGAGILAKTIETNWHERGAGHVKVERYKIKGTEAWGVRSNLVNGLPPSP
jgi:hypothetical protein